MSPGCYVKSFTSSPKSRMSAQLTRRKRKPHTCWFTGPCRSIQPWTKCVHPPACWLTLTGILSFAPHLPLAYSENLNEHFKRMSLLGDTGMRARIMLLLLWIIGHRLSEDYVSKLLSTTFGDAIKIIGGANEDLEAELAHIDSVNRVLVSLQKMIKRKLPLPPGILSKVATTIAKTKTNRFHAPNCGPMSSRRSHNTSMISGAIPSFSSVHYPTRLSSPRQNLQSLSFNGRHATSAWEKRFTLWTMSTRKHVGTRTLLHRRIVWRTVVTHPHHHRAMKTSLLKYLTVWLMRLMR
ncbi:hypothetical protein CPB85DRAFT_221418 [Mucidula mucida]|nr:hypothetical protein CPB85DRAFT_221418 [Mucidula mucida]